MVTFESAAALGLCRAARGFERSGAGLVESWVGYCQDSGSVAVFVFEREVAITEQLWVAVACNDDR